MWDIIFIAAEIMSMSKISVHTIARNERNWIWYSLMSVIDFVDEILVWDTGSSDDTVKIIQSINSPKIKFNQAGVVNEQNFTLVRQRMLEQTKSDWLMILDGDEIWPIASIRNTVNLIRSSSSQDLEYLIHPFYNLLGDVYHYQVQQGGNYKIGKYQGHITVRFLNLSLLPGLHFDKPHGQQGIYDKNGKLVQDRDPHKYRFMKDEHYLHATHLHRSSDDYNVMKRDFKFKYEWGLRFPDDFDYPVTFFQPSPTDVPSPWKRADLKFWFNASWQTPLRSIKRLVGPVGSGY